ncbi:MAG: tetratricopeptide repeat protein [Gallionella sp.]|nr:tetratricopeptide repeat protein [Gallionella sp.]
MNQKFLLTFVLLLSGLSGISYEILYGRILGGILGDQFAVSAAVLITFLLGIGLGAKYAYRLWSKLWLIEAGIGLYGIIFSQANQPIEYLLYHGFSFLPNLIGSILMGTLLLLLPAFLMGCSVPLFAGYIGRTDDRPVFSKVYAIYNFCAAATALLIEFWLIRIFGISGTVLAFGAANLVVAVILYFSAKSIANNPPVLQEAPIALSRNHVISLVLVSIASAIFQLFMVKISEMMFGPFRETFAIVLAIVLFGIALGSHLVKRWQIRYSHLLIANLIGLLSILVFYQDLMRLYAEFYESAAQHGNMILWLKSAILFALMGVPAITFGATIPALLNTQQEVAQESGKLLFISSIANVAGFLLMALVLHVYLDYGVQLLVMSGLVLSALLVYQWQTFRIEIKQIALSATAVVMVLLTVAQHHWRWDEDFLYLSYTSFHSLEELEQDRKDFNFPDKFKGYQDVFSINWKNNEPFFFINGYISIPMNNPSERIVGTIGSIMSPKTDEALVLGLGSGGTASVVGLLFGHTDVVEINPVVVENQFRMKRWNFDIVNNPKVHVVIDDAIHYTKSTQKQYDMILNTVTSPLYFSSSKLYTLDFFDVIKQRLRPEGVYVTWMDGRVGSEGARIIIKTLQKRFKYCTIAFIKSGYFLLIAGDHPVNLQHPDLVEKVPMLKKSLMQSHVVPRFLAYNLMTDHVFEQVSNLPTPINTIDNPVLEFEMASVKKRQFKEFRQPLVETITLDGVAKLLEPTMKYDPIEHVTHVRDALESSAITTQINQQGTIYIEDFIVRADAGEVRMAETLAEGAQTADAYHQLGDQYRNRQRYADALVQYHKALALEPKHKYTLFNLAACLEYLGEHEQALQEYQRAAQQDPKDPDVPYRLARVSLKMDKLTDAEKYIKQSIAMSPTEMSYLLKARLMEQQGRTDELIATYFAILKLNPDNSEVPELLNNYLRKW